MSLKTPTARNTVGRRPCGWGLRGGLRLSPGVVGRDLELFSHDSTFPSFSLLLFLLHLLVAAWALSPRQPGLNTLRTQLGLESGSNHSWQLECVFIPIYFLGLLCSPNPPNATKRHEWQHGGTGGLNNVPKNITATNQQIPHSNLDLTPKPQTFASPWRWSTDQHREHHLETRKPRATPDLLNQI